MRRSGRRARRDERGAVAVLAAVLMSLVLVTIAAFAVDLGMGRVGRRDMQAVADTVALDLARLLDGRTRSQIEAGTTGQPSLANALSASVARNGQDAFGNGTTVTPYLVELDASGGYAKDGSGLPAQVASTASPNGVVVVARTNVSFVFGKALGVSPSRTAVGSSDTSACFRLGSYGVRLTSSDSALLNLVLGKLLGGSVNLDVLSYKGLASANISLLSIAAKLGLGTVDNLLTTSVSASSLLLAAADVLRANGDTADANVLDVLRASVGPVPVKLGSLVTAAPGGGAAEAATIDALGLVTGTAYVANGTNAVSIPALATNLGLTGTSLTTALSIIEKPHLYCGKNGGTAKTSQVSLNISGNLLNAPSLTGLTGLSVNVGSLNVTTNIASATGTLTKTVCGAATAASPSGMDVDVQSSLVNTSVGTTVSVNGGITDTGAIGGLLNGILGLLGTTVKITVSGTVTLSAGTSAASTTKTAQIRVPNSPTTWDNPIDTGSGDLLASPGVTATWTTGPTIHAYTGVLGLSLVDQTLSASQVAGIASNVVSQLGSGVVAPVVNSLNSTLLVPLEHLLGLSVGGADVFGQKPSCSNPSLVG
jgi:uncharacterized membrane protein